MLPVVALDAGGAALRASVVGASSFSSAPLELANCVAYAPNAPATTLLGHELQTRERRDGGAKLRYVRPVERCVRLHLDAEVWKTICTKRDVTAVRPRGRFTPVATA